MSEKICVLGVAGGSASGKTTIINKSKVTDYLNSTTIIGSITIAESDSGFIN